MTVKFPVRRRGPARCVKVIGTHLVIRHPAGLVVGDWEKRKSPRELMHEAVSLPNNGLSGCAVAKLAVFVWLVVVTKHILVVLKSIKTRAHSGCTRRSLVASGSS